MLNSIKQIELTKLNSKEDSGMYPGVNVDIEHISS